MPPLRTARARRAAPIALAALALLAPSAAQAKIIELGKTATEPKPSCPTVAPTATTPGVKCLAMSRTTGYQASVGAEKNLFKVPEDGKLVAWTVTLAEPNKKEREFFEKTLGGKASAGVTVLRPGRKLYARTTGASPIEPLSAYFGQTVQFPLARALTVKKGYIVALTVPTWAPVLAINFGNDHSWRASRTKEQCDDTATQTAQTTPGALTRFTCLYRTARLTYSATIITDPKPAKRPEER